MSIELVRVAHNQTVNRSILLDKIDRSQGNFEGYAQVRKQKVYVPYVNPIDTAVAGYIDFVPTDEVLLSSDHGTISGLEDRGYITVTEFSSSLIVSPVITSAANAIGVTTIGGTTFLSLLPDITYVTLTNNITLATQKIPQSVFATHTNIQIKINDGVVAIGVPAAGWLAVVQANSKSCTVFTLT